jgi:hypothetical protein
MIKAAWNIQMIYLRKFDFNKHKNIQKMTAEEMIPFDDHLDGYQKQF